MDYEKDEQVIYFKDLLFVAMYQWRRILVFAVVLAVLLGGVAGITGWKNYTEAAEAVTEERNEYQLQLEKYEAEKQAIRTEQESAVQTLEDLQQAVKNSPLAGYDAYSLYTAYAVYTATVAPSEVVSQPLLQDSTHTVMHGYHVLLAGQSAAKPLAQTLGFDERCVGDVLTIAYNSEARTLKVSVTYTSAEKAKEGLAVVKKFMADAQKDISKATAEHTLNLVAEDLQNITFEQLQERWNNQEKIITELMGRLADLEDQAAQLVAPVAPYGISKAGVLKKAILFAAIGGVLGAFFVVAYAWLRHLAGGRVYSKRTLLGRTHIETIAAMDALKGNGLDCWLRRLEGRTAGKESRDVCGAVVRQYCSGSEKVQLLYCGTQPQEELENTLGSNVVSAQADTLQAVEQLAVCDSVVLVAQCHVSRYDMLRQQAKQVCDLGKKLIGCVLIDG